jgi:GAF domain-containing protein
MDRNDPSAVGPDIDVVGSLGVMQTSLPPQRNDIDTFLGSVAGLAAVAVAGELSCGITVHRDHSLLTVAASDERAALADEAQYGAGEGPGLAAMETGEVVYVRDQESDHRWEIYRLAALDRGVRCSLSLPLLVDGASAGALNLYDGRGPNKFDATARDRAEVFARQAATVLTIALRLRAHERMSDQVVEALRSRSTIDQALGILMAQEQCDADTAFTLLRQHSQATNQKLRDVATGLVERATGHPASPPSDFAT